MRLAAFALGTLALFVVPGCSQLGRVAASQPDQPSSDATVVEPCDLARFAEDNGLWGAKVFVSGVYVTDRQSFGYLKGSCSEQQVSGVEFAQASVPPPAGLEIRESAVSMACRGKSFCAYRADVSVEGILVRDDGADFGVLIRPTKYLVWKIHPEQ
jgi:hypothetical protein